MLGSFCSTTKGDPMNKRELICIANLIQERRWTRGLIREFLGSPDLSVPNPYYPNSHPVKLYKVSRVQRVEQSPLFMSRMRLIEKQRASEKARLSQKVNWGKL